MGDWNRGHCIIIAQLNHVRNATWQPVSKYNHVNEHRRSNQNAAILCHSRRLFQKQCHYGIQCHPNHNGMNHHGQTSFCHFIVCLSRNVL